MDTVVECAECACLTPDLIGGILLVVLAFGFMGMCCFAVHRLER